MDAESAVMPAHELSDEFLDHGMKMGMKPGIIPEGVDHHDHAQYSTSQVFLDQFIHHRPKEPNLFLTMLIME